MLNIEGLEFIEEIGVGGMATVWKARQLSLDRLVAVKVINKEALAGQEDRDRFLHEARTAARLNHPGIVQVYDAGIWDQRAYIILEHVDGQTAGDLVRKQRFIPEAYALEIASQVATALAYAWEKECLIHCDIKPDNILIDRNSGLIKLVDLGLARLIGPQARNPKDEFVCGTPNYTAPEQSAGLTDLDCRVDMYALGATLYHMVTGILPFAEAPGSEAMIRHERDFLEDPRTLQPELSVPASVLIEKLMIKDRVLRPHFWTEVLKDLEAVRSGRMPHAPLPSPGSSTVTRKATPMEPPKATEASGPSAPKKLVLKKSQLPPSSPVPTRKKSSRSPLVTIGLLMALAAGGAYWYQRQEPTSPSATAEPAAAAPVAETREEPEPLKGAAEETVQPLKQRTASDAWENSGFAEGAGLFNQALADYTEFQKTRSNPGILVSVEENCRKAISFFEAARPHAPAHIPVGNYITQCYGLISDVHLTRRVGDQAETDIRSGAASTTANPSPAAARRKIVFVDDEPEPGPPDAAPELPPSLTSLVFDADWESLPANNRASSELGRLLALSVEPSPATVVEADVELYPGITGTTKARAAAGMLNQTLPAREPLRIHGFPADSLYAYRFKGNFSGAGKLTLVVDRNDQVVMVQLQDERPMAPRLNRSLFSPTWVTLDFLGANNRVGDEGVLAHQAKRYGKLVRIDTEWADADLATIRMRMQMNMSARMAALLVHLARSER